MVQHFIDEIRKKYDIVAEINLDLWHDFEYNDARKWLSQQLKAAHKEEYLPNERIVFFHNKGDFYIKNQTLGLVLRNLQAIIDELQISNCFVIVVSSNPNLQNELNLIWKNSFSSEAIEGKFIPGDWTKIELNTSPSSMDEMYQYGSLNPLKMSLSELSEKEVHLLTESKVFCIYPWIHINANPDGRAYPCCMTDHNHPIGNCKSESLEQIWNNEKMRSVRLSMLNNEPVPGCDRCYEQERSGFFSGRLSANKHHGHHIGKILETNENGTVDKFEMIYWDIRFSNLCNLRCRSCGHIYSSQWYQDQAKLAGDEWKKHNKVLNYAGQHETDMWEQLVEHIEYVEQIYFAGGEPLIMDEHYRILEELERRGRFDVRLVYNTNFTEVHLKDRLVFDYWKKFKSVSVGASLDAQGRRGEYIRKGTDWKKVEDNRRKMIEICPEVDFYVSSTLSIMNAWHLTDFHKDWVEKGLIKAQDWNVNILLDPSHYRLDIAPNEYKQQLKDKFQNHIDWLKDKDKLQRATQGYQGAIKFMMATDNTRLIPLFWEKTNQLDGIRKENILDCLPELKALT